jgi:hypothetical protein
MERRNLYIKERTKRKDVEDGAVWRIIFSFFLAVQGRATSIHSHTSPALPTPPAALTVTTAHPPKSC